MSRLGPPICEEGGGGLVFPLFGDWENTSVPSGVRGILYAVGLVWFFLGVSIIADVFMSSIEKVTSSRTKRQMPDGTGNYATPLVWNKTVATLSLMALGSSAPEIFLSIIDIMKKGFHFGALGPSTIVGSAAFNLFVIIAVCMVVIPVGETRAIENLPAFYITAWFSLVAYLWMAFILVGTSPDIVDIWEALVTLALLPVLIWCSYKVDKGAADGLLRQVGLISAEEDAKEDPQDDFLAFSDQTKVVFGEEREQTLEIKVNRIGAAEHLGKASCKYRTESMTAMPTLDYEEVEGTLEFDAGETSQTIELPLMSRSSRLRDTDLLLILEEPEGGPRFEPEGNGGEECAIMTITLQAFGPKPDDYTAALDAVFGVDVLELVRSDWREQFEAAWYCNGSAEEQAEASPKDWAYHVAAVPWKLLFACMPPTRLGGGWVCFYASLGGIAMLTAAVSDLAELFGCVLKVPDIITAITFVALGTSMPDLFASISAAADDETADASIVNVTGSNSVNVFLGLGVPWTLAALYWAAVGRTPAWEQAYPEVAGRISGSAFVVEADDLGFSVGTFSYLCILALFLLQQRRQWLEAELGGDVTSKYASSCAMVTYWLLWVVLVSGYVLDWWSSAAELAIVSVFTVLITVGVTAVPLCFMRMAAAAGDSPQDGGEGEEGSDDGKGVGTDSAGYIGSDSARKVVPAAKPKFSNANEGTAWNPNFLDVAASQASRPVPPKSCTALYCDFFYKLLMGSAPGPSNSV